jgi:hypothetical protein
MTLASPYPKPGDPPLPPPTLGTSNGGRQTHRTLDPVRAAALHEAVEAWLQTPRIEDDATGSYDPITEILEVAERFEAWLAGPEAE